MIKILFFQREIKYTLASGFQENLHKRNNENKNSMLVRAKNTCLVSVFKHNSDRLTALQVEEFTDRLKTN